MPLTDRDRRTLIIGGGILGVLLLGFFLFNSLAGGGGDAALPTLPPITVAPTGGPGVPGSESPSVAPTTGQEPVFTGRDPFSIPPALAQVTTSPPVPSVTVSGSVTVTIPPPTTTTPITPTTPPPSNPGGGSSTVKGDKTVVLLDTFQQGGEPMVQVEVDGTVYNVGIGEPFGGGSFELRSVSGDCATFLYGDEPFTLCANSTK
ncbi:MAG TPA: hypothetical protein VI341_01845 [Actinomycetota bacterium]